MAHGGKRSGSGRRKKPVLPAAAPLSRGLAVRLHSDESTERRWRELRDTGDHWFRLSVEKYIWDRAEGRPVSQVRLANPEGEKFKMEVDVTSARDKLMAFFLAPAEAGPAPQPGERSLAEACREQIRTGAPLSEEEAATVRTMEARHVAGEAPKQEATE